MGPNRLHQRVLAEMDLQNCSFKCGGDQGRSLTTEGKAPQLQKKAKGIIWRAYPVVSITSVSGKIMELVLLEHVFGHTEETGKATASKN